VPVACGTRVGEHLAACRPAVVAVQGWSEPSALETLAWCRLQRIPVVMMGDFQAVERRPGGPSDGLKGRLLRGCEGFLVAGTAHAAFLAELGISRERIALGYDVVDNQHFRLGAEAARARAAFMRDELGLPERYFLAVGRLAPEKNLELLLRAHAICCRVCAERAWELVVVGEGPLRNKLEAHARVLGTFERVHFVGHQSYDVMPAYYGLASVFVHASTFEPWGLVVNEAMAAGLPVFVSRLASCSPDLVADNGVVFDPCRVRELSNPMVRACLGQYDLAAMGARSRERIASWSPETFAARLWKSAELALATGASSLGWLDRMLPSLLARLR